jgi:DNA-binding transcriptional ArsR family regulator
MELRTALAAFSALAQEVRLDVLKRLVRAGPAGVSAGALAEATGVAAPTMSFHLKELLGAGLVRSRKEGRSVIYAADYGGIRTLVGFLLADCCQGDPRLCGPYIVTETKHDAPACAP